MAKHPRRAREDIGGQVVFVRRLPVDPELVSRREPVLANREHVTRAHEDRVLCGFGGTRKRDGRGVPKLLREIANLRDPSIETVQDDFEIHVRSKEKGPGRFP